MESRLPDGYSRQAVGSPDIGFIPCVPDTSFNEKSADKLVPRFSNNL